MALAVLVKRMREGHIPSVKELLARLDRGRAAPPVKKAEDLGKKEMAQRAAERPTDGWGELLDAPAPKVH